MTTRNKPVIETFTTPKMYKIKRLVLLTLKKQKIQLIQDQFQRIQFDEEVENNKQFEELKTK